MRAFIRVVVYKLYKLINNMPFNNTYNIRNTKIINYGKIMIGCKIISKGSNTIILHNGGSLKNTNIRINGNNNIVEIGENTHMLQGEVHIEDNGNRVVIGNNTSFCGRAHLACTEGREIIIGDDCLFSSDLVFRTGDSHSIVDLTGKRINPAADILIGNHVWIGHHVFINKGVIVPNNTVVGTGAILTKKFEQTNTAIAGVPAKVVKTDINWLGERI